MLFGKRDKAIKRILVVEDEPLIAFDTEHLLTGLGYHVVATVDREAGALSVIAQHGDEIDLVLADVGLSDDGDGIRVAEAAHARGINVLFVTGSCPGHARHLAVGCLSKPYSDRVLRTALETLDSVLRGETVRRAPEQLTIFAKDAA